jgi:hypothetical protein
MFQAESGWSGYPDARLTPMGDLWDGGGALGGEYQQRSSAAGVAHVVNAPNKLRLRSEPSTDSETLAYIDNGGTVVFYADLGNGWADVEWYGTRGFASMQYLEMGEGRAGQSVTIPPYEPPAPPAPEVIDLDQVTPTPPPEAPKKNTAWYVVGGAAALAALYYLT